MTLAEAEDGKCAKEKASYIWEEKHWRSVGGVFTISTFSQMFKLWHS